MILFLCHHTPMLSGIVGIWLSGICLILKYNSDCIGCRVVNIYCGELNSYRMQIALVVWMIGVAWRGVAWRSVDDYLHYYLILRYLLKIHFGGYYCKAAGLE